MNCLGVDVSPVEEAFLLLTVSLRRSGSICDKEISYDYLRAGVIWLETTPEAAKWTTWGGLSLTGLGNVCCGVRLRTESSSDRLLSELDSQCFAADPTKSGTES